MEKTISILGTNNRYLMKKVTKTLVEEKIRKCSDNWSIMNQHYLLSECDETTSKEINKKISGYKQQDVKKNRYEESEFITFDYVIGLMKHSQLMCRYCSCELYILYDNVRDKKQWTIDRIDNSIGHNMGNVHLSCLGCNLKRRNTSDAKFNFTKNLTIHKLE